MKLLDPLPAAVHEVSHFWIELQDGTRLAARRWQPASDEPVPVILEYIPYRKSDATAISDAGRYRYLAAHGYACVRVDIRGSGDSDGILNDEYTEPELSDGVEVIAWLAAQDWCNGSVGMTGISWGGFNALQIAARRPPALKAIISACSTDDRYRDDVHYLGGTVLASDMLGWALSFMSFVTRPPLPEVAGTGWRQQWIDRLQAAQPFVTTWLEHQTRDSYWHQGSVCEHYGDIQCPVLLVGGWADGYTNSIFRMLKHLEAPVKALIGPWAHGWPDSTLPGPQIGYLQETLRWWDAWLKTSPGQVANDPPLRYWQQQFVSPDQRQANAPGCWIATAAGAGASHHLHLDASGPTRVLNKDPGPRHTFTIAPDLWHGQHGGDWCPFGSRRQLPADQQEEDRHSTVFDTPPLTEPLHLLGAPVFQCRIADPEASGHLVARLCEVSPTGESYLVSRGVVNLRDQPDNEISMTLDAVGHRTTPGNLLRLALARSYWPLVWPEPSPTTLSLQQASLKLPLDTDGQLLEQPFQAPEQAQTIAYEVLEPPGYQRELATLDEGFRISSESSSGRIRIDDVTTFSHASDQLRLAVHNPLSAAVSCERHYEYNWQEHDIRIEMTACMTADQDNFRVNTQLVASDGDTEVHRRNWDHTIPRRDAGRNRESA